MKNALNCCGRLGMLYYDFSFVNDEGSLLFLSLRYNIKQIGGSEAQRDIFSLMLINACLKSTKLKHNRLAGQLIEEREILRSKSPLIDRLRLLL